MESEELVARLRAELAEKEGAIRQAAQYGQMMTSRMKELETAVKDRDKELEEAYARLTEHESRTKELEKRLSSTAAPSEELRIESSKSAYQEQYLQLSSRYELLQEQLSEATSMNKQLHRTIEEKDAALLRYQQAEKANQELREFANHHAEQTELLSAQLDEAKRTILDLRKYNESLKVSVEELKQTKMVAIAEASEQQRTDEEKEKIEQQLKERLLRAETRVREQEEQIAEYRLQKRKLDDAVAAMARQTQVLYKERDELAGRLADATSKIGTLVRTASQIHTQEELEVSLMDDIEDTHSLDTLIPADEDLGGDSLLDALAQDEQPAPLLEQELVDNGLFDPSEGPPLDDESLVVAAAAAVAIGALADEGESQPLAPEPAPVVAAAPQPVAAASSSSSSSSSSARDNEQDDGMMLPGGNMDARCEEFFYLAATSIKIQMAIQNPQFSDGVFRINIKALHDQAIQSDVPFHEWYEWLKVALRKKQAALISSVTTTVHDPINRVEGFYDGSQIHYDDHIERAPATPPKPQTPPPAKRGWFGLW